MWTGIYWLANNVSASLMDYEGLIDDNRVLISLIACSMNYETAVTFTYGHFNKVVFAVYTATMQV